MARTRFRARCPSSTGEPPGGTHRHGRAQARDRPRLASTGVVNGVEGDWDLVDVTYRYADALRDEVLGLGGMAKVVSPVDIADDVRRYAESALAVAESALGRSAIGESTAGEGDDG